MFSGEALEAPRRAAGSSRQVSAARLGLFAERLRGGLGCRPARARERACGARGRAGAGAERTGPDRTGKSWGSAGQGAARRAVRRGGKKEAAAVCVCSEALLQPSSETHAAGWGAQARHSRGSPGQEVAGQSGGGRLETGGMGLGGGCERLGQLAWRGGGRRLGRRPLRCRAGGCRWAAAVTG